MTTNVVIGIVRVNDFFYFRRLSAEQSKKIVKETNNTPFHACSGNEPYRPDTK